jgi:RimJ/RimL family protein N-acetyltransferase
MQIQCSRFILREFRPGDEHSLVENANDYAVWRHLRDRFPHPYTLKDAEDWIDYANQMQPQINFAIEVARQVVGGIGLLPQEDVYRYCAEIGYWLGEKYRGRGIMPEAVTVITQYAFATFEIERIYACVFATNLASQRVLQKAGYYLEAVRKKAVIKEGQLMDDYVYVRLRT